MALIYFLLRSSWGIVTLAIVTGFISGVSTTGLIGLISRVLSQGNINRLLLISFLGLAAIALLTNILSQVLLVRLAQQAIFQLRLRLVRQIFSAELPHIEQLGSPRLLATLIDDVQTVAESVRLVPFICSDLAIVAGCFAFITWLSWQVALIIFGLLIIALTGYRWILQHARHQLALAREEQDSLFQHLQSVTEGIKELKLHARRRQAFLGEQLQPTMAAYQRYNIRGLMLFAAIANWGKFLFFSTLGFVIFVLPNFLAFSPAVFSGYILTMIYLSLPMEGLINRLPALSRARVALDKLELLGLTLGSHAEVTGPLQAPLRRWHKLQLKGAVYTYTSDREDFSFSVGPIDLVLRPGEIIFVVGGNGSGKSTLAKVLTGLYRPEAGEIWLDESRIDEHNREWYRQHFAVIFADFYLFDRLLGLDTVNTDAAAISYLKQLHLDHKVTVEQGHLSTTQLSQGQRKRLALLTAYLEDRPVYLFDEWAADQDPEFKALFYTEFLPDLRDRGKLVIVITHDDQYFHLADHLIKLNYGKLDYERRRST